MLQYRGFLSLVLIQKLFTMTKIEALRKTIYNLENDVYCYSWTNLESCNCGVLAKTILGGKSIYDSGFNDSPLCHPEAGVFSRFAYCMTTNLPLPEVYQSLKDCGFSHKELFELEYLSNPLIAKRLGWRIFEQFTIEPFTEDYANKSCLIEYLKEWVKILEEYQPVKVITRYVSVSESIKQLEIQLS